MKSYMIGYDLNKPRANNDYKDLIARIKAIAPNYWHCLDSTWIIKSDWSADQIRNELMRFLDAGDEMLVVLLTRESAWHGFDANCSKWLHDNL